MANENIVIEYNQVEALTIEEDVAKEIILDEVPDGRPIHIPIADYENPGIASFDKRYFIIDNKGRVSSVAHNPTEIFIRYSAYSDGTDFTDTWDSGKYYIGIAIGKVLPTNKADYSWSKFIGTDISVGDVTTIIGEASTDASVLVTPRPVDPLIPTGDLYLDFVFTIPKSADAICTSDDASGNINYELLNDTDKTFVSDAIVKLIITISSAFHGYFAGVNFKVRSSGTTISFVNTSGLSLKLMLRGVPVESYTLTPNRFVMIIVTCDGVNIYCNLIEV